MNTAALSKPSRPAARTSRVLWHWESNVLFHRDEPICQFEPDRVVLREIRLRPGGESLIGGAGCPMGWRMFWGTHEPMICDSFETRADRDTAELLVHSHEKDQREHQQFRLTVRKTARGFEYEAHSSIEADADIFGRESKLEFMNFLPTWMTLPGLSGFEYMRAGTDPLRQTAEYQYYSFDAEWELGQRSLLPLNLLYLSSQSDIHLRPDGVIAAIHSPRGNPAVQLLGKTASHSCAFLCNAMWDLHLVNGEYAYARQQRVQGKPELREGERHEAHWRVFQLTEDESQAFRREGVVRRVSDAEAAERRFPALRLPLTRFDIAVNAQDHDPSRFFTPWMDDVERARIPAGLHMQRPHYEPGVCVWTTTDGEGCLQVETKTGRTAGWQLAGVNTIPLRVGVSYRISAETRTRDLAGEGAWLAAATADRDLGLRSAPVTEWTRSAVVRGTPDWTVLSVDVRLDRDIRLDRRVENRVRVALFHSGCGVSEFRRFRCEEIR